MLVSQTGPPRRPRRTRVMRSSNGSRGRWLQPARARGLVAAENEFEACFAEAMARHEETQTPSRLPAHTSPMVPA